MLRAGRFRHRLLDDDFLKTHSDIASSCLKDFLHQWRLGTLSDIEISAIYIFIFGFLRRPQDFLGGPHNKELHPVSSGAKISCKKVHAILLGNLPEHSSINQFVNASHVNERYQPVNKPVRITL